jgi:outer membrane receptor for ferrienterochelin and colicin
MLFQMPFDFLPSPMDGFGTINTYSYIDSETKDINIRTGAPLPITGLSKHNLNTTLYWEKGRWNLRAAYNWRGKYLESIGPGGSGVFFDSGDNLSLSARVQITDELSLDVQANNVLDSRIRKFGGVEDATLLYGMNGRTFSIGLRGKF